MTGADGGVIDQRIMDAYFERSADMARRGILECSRFDQAMADGKTIEQYMRDVLAEDGLLPNDDICSPCRAGNHVKCGLDACTCVCPPDQQPQDEA